MRRGVLTLVENRRQVVGWGSTETAGEDSCGHMALADVIELAIGLNPASPEGSLTEERT